MEGDAFFLIFMIIFFGIWYVLCVVGAIKHWYDLIKCIKHRDYKKAPLHIYSFCFASIMIFAPLWFYFHLHMRTVLYMVLVAMAISGVIIYYLPDKQVKAKVVVPQKPVKNQPISAKTLKLEQQGSQLWTNYSHKDSETFWTKYEQLLEKMRDLK
jgi:hypothetical protein